MMTRMLRCQSNQISSISLNQSNPIEFFKISDQLKFYIEGPTISTQMAQQLKSVNVGITTDILLRLPVSLKLVAKISVQNSKVKLILILI